MKLSTQVGTGPAQILLDGDPAPLKKGHSTPNFMPMSIVANGRPSQLLLSTCSSLHRFSNTLDENTMSASAT